MQFQGQFVCYSVPESGSSNADERDQNAIVAYAVFCSVTLVLSARYYTTADSMVDRGRAAIDKHY